MKAKYIKYLCIIACIFTFACSDFISVEDPGLLSVDEFYKTDDDVIQAVTAVYDIMQSDHLNDIFANFYLLKGLLSDEIQAGGAGEGDQMALQQINKYNFNSESVTILAVWRHTYYCIGRANQVISKTEPTTDMQRRLVAEAKTLRAYNYLELVALWGGVPIILENLSPDEFTTQERASPGDVYAQIEKDLIEAIPVLPEKSAYPAGDKFRVSKGTARAILGKAYLYQEKWSNAAEQFNEIIISNEYQLESNFGLIFNYRSEFGKESLLELSYTKEPNAQSGRNRTNNRYIQLIGARNWYVIFPGDSIAGGGWGFCYPRHHLYDAFITAGDTMGRKKNTLMSVEEVKAWGGNWTKENAYGFENVIRRKYGNFISERGADDKQSYGTNWRLIRYADVLLMAAEAYYRIGNEGRARIELNKVRNRAELIDSNASGGDLFEAIVLERQLEMAFEYSRYNDLIRWGRAAQVLGKYGWMSGKNELLPIPNDDVRAGKIAQNPGW